MEDDLTGGSFGMAQEKIEADLACGFVVLCFVSRNFIIQN